MEIRPAEQNFSGHRTRRKKHILAMRWNVMVNCFSQLRRKEVINICDGCRLGYVGDVEIKIPEGEVKAIIVFGPCRFFGLFGRGEDYYIPWDCIQKFGSDIILIDKPFQRRERSRDDKRRKRF